MSTRPFTLMALLAVTSSACTGKVGDTSIDGGLRNVNGIVFKGPMNSGSAITIEPLTDAGEADGDPVETTVSDDAGSYTGAVTHSGLVRLIALGTMLDEAHGADGTTAISLYAYGIVGPDAPDLHVNVFTDLSHVRIETLLAGGMAPDEAIAQAQEELVASLPIGLGEPPGAEGYEVNPYEEGLAQSVLFADSAVLAQAGKDMEDLGTGSLSDLLGSIRADLADDGALDAALSARIHVAEVLLDPDLARLSLQTRLDRTGLDLTVPDLHPALDSDHDGVANSEDNCRYVANDDQTDSAGLGFGDVCDYRLDSIGTTENFGCGVLTSDGSVVCWDVTAGLTGGGPPLPDVYPAHPDAPWRDRSFLTGAMGAIAAGDNIICAIPRGGGDLHCWIEGASEDAVYAGDYVLVRAAGGVVCALDRDGALLCVNNASDTLATDRGPYRDVTIFGNGGICTLDQDTGALAWLDYPDMPSGLPSLPSDAYGYTKVVASTDGWGCALSAYDGSLACFGDKPTVTDAPTTSGWVDLAIGEGMGCVLDEDGVTTCWRDPATCPEVEDAPPDLTSLQGADCQMCGIDKTGFGHCWPRKWNADNPPD